MANTRKIQYETLVDLADEVAGDDDRAKHPTYEFSKKTFYESDQDGHYNTDKAN